MDHENTTLREGTVLQSRYRVETVLEQDDFGILYLGTHISLESKIVIREFFLRNICERDEFALKVVVSLDNLGCFERYQESFFQRAKVLALFSHPNIVHVMDVFKANQTVYYVMEFIEGESLETIVEYQEPLPADEALRYIRGIGDALVNLHKQGLSHLGVRPNNIILDQQSKQAILLGFDEIESYDSEKKSTGLVRFDPNKAYWPSVFSLDASSSHLDPILDVYALAATFYKLLTGMTPPASHLLSSNQVSIDSNLKGINKQISDLIVTILCMRDDRPRRIEDFLDSLPLLSEKSNEEQENNEEDLEEATTPENEASFKEEDISSSMNKDKCEVDETIPEVDVAPEQDVKQDSIDHNDAMASGSEQGRPVIDPISSRLDWHKIIHFLSNNKLLIFFSIVIFLIGGLIGRFSLNQGDLKPNNKEEIIQKDSLRNLPQDSILFDKGMYWECFYKGDLVNGRREGYGIARYTIGDVYEGQWANDLIHGKGTYIWANGEKYIGDWYKGLKKGHGVYYYINGAIYDGEWSEDKRNGQGTLTVDENKYVGEFYNDMFHGHGIFSMSNGDFFDGQYIEGNMVNGTLTFSNGDKYIGAFNNNQFDGMGVYYFNNGDIYDGQFARDKANGRGVYTWSNGEIYVGEYKNWQRHGKGTLYAPNGSIIYRGQWKNDKRYVK